MLICIGDRIRDSLINRTHLNIITAVLLRILHQKSAGVLWYSDLSTVVLLLGTAAILFFFEEDKYRSILRRNTPNWDGFPRITSKYTIRKVTYQVRHVTIATCYTLAQLL